jgi:glutathione peroxidase
MTTFFDFEMDDIDGNPIDFSTYRGSVSLVVNVASR